jgi:hypothetical protein
LVGGVCKNGCPEGTFNTGVECIQCGVGCKTCLSEYDCSECKNSIEFSLINGHCVCDGNCENCLPSAGGCSICGKKQFYDINIKECRVCDIERLERDPIYFIFQTCTGKLQAIENGISKEIGIGFSGVGDKKNDVCGQTSKESAIPIGVYIISDIQCALKNRSSSRVYKVSPVKKFSNDTAFEPIFSNLFIYAQESVIEGGKVSTPFSDGQNGIAIPKQFINLLTLGDQIEVTSTGCDSYILACPGKMPAPIIGEIKITYGADNAFWINFLGWGDSEAMDLNKFEYSAQINIGNKWVELCNEDTDLNVGEGLYCNQLNVKKLGYFGKNGTFPLKARARYIGDKGASWAESMTEITIVEISTGKNAADVLDVTISVADPSELINELNYRKQAIDAIIDRPLPPPKVEDNKCPDGFCQNGATCTIKEQRPRCKCTTGWTGITCEMDVADRDLVVNQNKKAAESLMALIDGISPVDPSSTIDIINSITSNTDAVSSDTISNVITALDDALKDEAIEIDTTTLTATVTNVLSAMIKDIMNTQSGARRKLAADTNKVEQLNKLKKGFKKIIKSNLETVLSSEAASSIDIEGQTEALYFPSSVGEVSTDSAVLSTDTDSLVCGMQLPIDMAALFPIPAGDANNTNVIGSNVISFNAQAPTGLVADIVASKKIKFMKSGLTRRLTDTTTSQCGYYDEVAKAFSTVGCTTTTDASGNVVCTCSTANTNFYVVLTTTTSDNSTTNGAGSISAYVTLLMALLICII